MSIELKICLGCYASYNDGYLFDKWYTVTDSSELNDVLNEFEKHVIKSIKEARPEWVKEGYISDTYAEELYIADSEAYYDGEFIKYDFNECILSAENFLDAFEGTFNNSIELLIQVAKDRGQDLEELSQLDDELFCFEVDSKSNSDLSYAYCEITGFFDEFENAETLINYFDHDSYGNELSYEFSIYEVGNTYYAVGN